MNSATILLSAVLGLVTLELVSGQTRWNGFNNNGYNGYNRPASANQLGQPQPATNNAGKQNAGTAPQPMSPMGKLLTGIAGGMAEQIIGVCPNMCENILDQINTINPQIVSMVRVIFPCSNVCRIAENFLNGGIGMMANMVSRIG